MWFQRKATLCNWKTDISASSAIDKKTKFTKISKINSTKISEIWPKFTKKALKNRLENILKFFVSGRYELNVRNIDHFKNLTSRRRKEIPKMPVFSLNQHKLLFISGLRTYIRAWFFSSHVACSTYALLTFFALYNHTF